MATSPTLAYIRCVKSFPLSAHARGCDACAGAGVASSLTFKTEVQNLPKLAPATAGPTLDVALRQAAAGNE